MKKSKRMEKDTVLTLSKTMLKSLYVSRSKNKESPHIIHE